MTDQITGGQTDGTSQAYPILPDAGSNESVTNIPATNVPPGMAMNPGPAHERAGATLNVHGQKVPLSYEQLVTAAQKGLAADANFQAASETSRKAASAIEFQEDMRLVAESGDADAFRRAGASLGIPGDKVEESIRLIDEQYGDGDGTPDENRVFDGDTSRRGQGRTPEQWAQELAQVKSSLENRQIGFEQVSPDLQTALIHVEQERISRIVEKSLDSDDVLRYYIANYDEKGKDAIRGMIDDKIRGRLDAADGQFGDGKQIMQEIIPEVRALVEAIGTPERSTPQMGLGPAPGSQGPAVYPTKPPDHVSSTDAGFEEHIVEALAHNIHKASTG